MQRCTSLVWSGYWLDHNNGILGHYYGAGGGGTYRYYMDNNELYFDGDVEGYVDSYDSDSGTDSRTSWFRDSEGNKKILSPETEEEYRRFWDNLTALESYDITESNIARIIYGKNPNDRNLPPSTPSEIK